MSDRQPSSLFASDRERRLWAWTLAVVVAIYSTLGLARALADALGDSTLIGAGLFLVCCFLVLATVVTQGLSVRPGGAEIAVALGVAAAYILVFVRMAIPTERSHLIEYGVVAVLVHEALRERASHGRRVPAPGLLAVLAGLAGLVGPAARRQASSSCCPAACPAAYSTPSTCCSTFSAGRWPSPRAPPSAGRGGSALPRVGRVPAGSTLPHADRERSGT